MQTVHYEKFISIVEFLQTIFVIIQQYGNSKKYSNGLICNVYCRA